MSVDRYFGQWPPVTTRGTVSPGIGVRVDGRVPTEHRVETRKAEVGVSGMRRAELFRGRGRRVFMALAIAWGISMFAQVPAASSQTPLLSWLAAGDSYSSGEGLPHAIGNCAQAQQGPGSESWPGAAHDILATREPSLARPVLVACTGARSDQFFANDASGQPEWTPAAGRFALISFTFGGDDVSFPDVLQQCVGLTIGRKQPADHGHSCPKDSTLRARIASKIGRPYRDFLTQVANQAAKPGGNIIVLGYPELVELPKFWPVRDKALGVCARISTADANELRGLAGDLNATIGSDVATVNAARPNGVHLTFVDVNSGGSAGISRSDPNLFEPATGQRHNLCSAHPWMNGPSTIDKGYGSYHPKQAGHNAMGALAAEVIPHLDWSGLPGPSGGNSPSGVPASGGGPGPGGPSPNAGSTPGDAYAETVGGVTHTWTNYSNAGGTQGPSIQTGQTVGIACKVQGFRVADGDTWWYKIASDPWNGAYYASADAFYNNGQTSGSLHDTPFVDNNVPDCTTSPPPPPPPPPPTPTPTPTPTYAETVGGVTHTWTNYSNAGGTQGPSIQTGQTVGIACKVQGFRVADGDTWWYKIASDPWNGAYYASADAFYNNGQTSGSLHGTPFVDNNVPDC